MNTITNNTFRKTLITHVAAACFALGAAAAHAAEPASTAQAPSKVVEFGDLNTTSRQGIERLYQRIVTAANEVCQQHGDRSLANFEQTRICIKQTTAKAVASVGNPGLAALYAAKSGQPTARVAKLAGR